MLVEAGLTMRNMPAAPYWFGLGAIAILVFFVVATLAIGKGRPGRK